MRIGRRGLLVVTSLIAVALAAGIGYAAVPGVGGVISACYDRQGNVRVIDAEAGDTCRPRERALNWNEAGQPGPIGPVGPAGPVGPSDAFVTTMPGFGPLLDGVTFTIATITLPAGKYVIDAPVRLHSQGIYGGEASVWCDLLADDVQIDHFSHQFGLEESYRYKAVPFLGWTEVPSEFTVEIRCQANYSQIEPGYLSDIDFDGGPLVATRVGNLTWVDWQTPDN